MLQQAHASPLAREALERIAALYAIEEAEFGDDSDVKGPSYEGENEGEEEK